jgi:hypothetical protein
MVDLGFKTQVILGGRSLYLKRRLPALEPDMRSVILNRSAMADIVVPVAAPQTEAHLRTDIFASSNDLRFHAR